LVGAKTLHVKHAFSFVVMTRQFQCGMLNFRQWAPNDWCLKFWNKMQTALGKSQTYYTFIILAEGLSFT